jgi:hypothetical protein
MSQCLFAYILLQYQQDYLHNGGILKALDSYYAYQKEEITQDMWY